MIKHFSDERTGRKITNVNVYLIIIIALKYFRRHCAVTILRAWGFGKTVATRGRRGDHSNSGISAAAQQLRTINQELGINVQGDPDAEVVLRELDPQSKILCGIGQKWNHCQSDKYRFSIITSIITEKIDFFICRTKISKF